MRQRVPGTVQSHTRIIAVLRTPTVFYLWSAPWPSVNKARAFGTQLPCVLWCRHASRDYCLGCAGPPPKRRGPHDPCHLALSEPPPKNALCASRSSCTLREGGATKCLWRRPHFASSQCTSLVDRRWRACSLCSPFLRHLFNPRPLTFNCFHIPHFIAPECMRSSILSSAGCLSVFPVVIREVHLPCTY